MGVICCGKRMSDTGPLAAIAPPRLLDGLWRCRCGQTIGAILPDGRLQIGAAILVRADYECAICGCCKHWGAADYRLERAIEQWMSGTGY